MKHSLIRSVALSLLFSLLAPALNCAAIGVATKDAGSACCHAMNFACHNQQAPTACCKREASAPSLNALPLPARKASGVPPLFVTGFLSVPEVLTFATPSLTQYQNLFVGHSPPGNLRVFLLNSALLI
ncbi:MAG: hypothetical protein ACYDA9_09850 [Terriglobia bacterium]